MTDQQTADTKVVTRHGSLALAVLSGFVVFLYQMADVIGKLQSWEVLWNPPSVAQMFVAIAAALGAGVGALFLDIPALVKSIAALKRP